MAYPPFFVSDGENKLLFSFYRKYDKLLANRILFFIFAKQNDLLTYKP